MKNIKVTILSFIALVLLLTVYFLSSTATWSIPNEFDRITIRNGTTGDLYEVTGEDLTDFRNRMESVEFHRCEICGPAMGFIYNLTFYVENEEIDSITLKGENKLERNFCRYLASEDMLTLIEDFLGDLD